MDGSKPRHSWHLRALEGTGINYEENDEFVSHHHDDERKTSLYLADESATFQGSFRETVYLRDDPTRTTMSDLNFSSDFECGNLQRVDRIHSSSYRVDEPIHYALWLHSDPCIGEPDKSTVSTQWFFFRCTGMQENVEYRFHIVNFCKQTSVLSNGMRPVICDDHIENDLKMSTSRKKSIPDQFVEKGPLWHRSGSYVKYQASKDLGFLSKEETNGKFCYSFTLSLPRTGGIYVSLTQPYSYSNLQHELGKLSSPHVRRNCLCLSPQGRRVDLVIATENSDEHVDDIIMNHAKTGVATMKSPVLGTFQEDGEKDETDCDSSNGHETNSVRRTTEDCPLVPFQRRYKPVLFFCARTVSGDAPSSFVVEGLITWLASSDIVARSLRQRFVIMIVPLLNPDGCAMGNARTDAVGCDMSLAWLCPNRASEPSIYFCKRFLRRLSNQGRLAACIEIGAHSRQIGSFFYGIRLSIENMHSSSLVLLASRRRGKQATAAAAAAATEAIMAEKRGPLPASFIHPPHWDFLLAFMRRSPFLMEHRACSFETPDLLCPPLEVSKGKGLRKIAAFKKHITEPVATRDDRHCLSMRQALHRLKGCPHLCFTYYVSIFKGSKGPQGRRHLHPGDYRNAGHALLLALAESLGFTIHRNNRESYIVLKKHNAIGGSQAAHFAMDRDFAVLERALRMGSGGLSGRHNSYHIAQAIQTPGHDKSRIDDDLCVDLDIFEAQEAERKAHLRSLGWADSKNGSWNNSESPLTSDDERDEQSDESSENDSDNGKRKFCFHCKDFGHDWGLGCPYYIPPPPLKKRADQDYYITGNFYQNVVNRFLKRKTEETAVSATQRWGTGKPLQPNYATNTKSNNHKDAAKIAVLKYPKLTDLVAHDEILWLASHFPVPAHIGGMRSRKLQEQANNVDALYDTFKHAKVPPVNPNLTNSSSSDTSSYTIIEKSEQIASKKSSRIHIDSKVWTELNVCHEEPVISSRSLRIGNIFSCVIPPAPPITQPPSSRSIRMMVNIVIPPSIVRDAKALTTARSHRIVVPNTARPSQSRKI